MGRRVTIQGKDGSFSAYVADAKRKADSPAIVVIQEIFGVNKVMRDIADSLAEEGYTAVVPDLFWRIEPGIDITDKTDAEWKKAFELFGKFNVDKGVEDLRAALQQIRKHHACDGRAGAVGYCLGGKLAYLMATRSDADANVGYYGVGIEKALDEAQRIAKPLLLHIAEKDEYCPPAAQAQIKAALGKNPRVTIHAYPGADHAFARSGGQHYDKAAADTANQRAADFFKKNLS